MAELAFNLNGERFELPATAAWWRVRRLRDVPRGGLEVVYARDGLPLIIPIDAGIDELRRCVDDVAGKYRLDPVDERHQPVPEVAAAYITIAKSVERNAGSQPMAIELPKGDTRDELLRELVRANADMTKTMADRFASVMEAAATLLRAADGAGLPARPGTVVVDASDGDDDGVDDDDDVEAGRTGPDLMALLSQFMPLLCTLVGSRGLDLSKLGAMFGMGGAAKKQPTDAGGSKPKPSTDKGSESASKPAAQRATQPATDGVSPAATTPTAQNDAPDAGLTNRVKSAAVDPIARLLEIEAMLTPAERARAQAEMAEMSPSEITTWTARLCQGTVSDAVELIRAEIATSKGGATDAEDAA